MFSGGPIETMDPALGRVEALAIRDGVVTAAGDLAAVEARVDSAVRIDLAGRTLLPGLIDTHPHLLHFAALEAPLVDITSARTHAEIAERITERAAVTPAGDWIMTTPVGEPHFFVTHSWRHLAEGRLPDRQVLDRVSSEHPIMIQAWAPVTPNAIAFNSLALAALGIDESLPDRIGNVWIEKGPGGAPTGLLTGSVNNYYSGDAFADSLWAKIPYLDLELVIPSTVRAMAEYNAQGVTAVYENHGMEGPFVEVYRHLRAEDQLSLRVAVAQEAEAYTLPGSQPKEHSDFVRDCETAVQNLDAADERFRFLGLSFMRDGSCWSGDMQMRDAYAGPYGEPTTGKEFIAKDRAALAMQICAESKARLNTIVMGTHAHDENLAQLEEVARAYDIGELGWLLVHGWFVEPEQARRYGQLGMDATTSMAFTWGQGGLYRERLKPSAMADLVPLRRLLDSGLRVGGGSDWGPKNSFRQIELALTHEVAGSDEANAGPAQRISREEALAMWTRDAAGVLGWDEIGTLAPGKLADLAITDRNPLDCPVEAIGATVVEATLLGGRVVHGDLPG